MKPNITGVYDEITSVQPNITGVYDETKYNWCL